MPTNTPSTAERPASPSTARLPGNLGAWLLRRDRTEFITLSLWDSVDAIRAFAGDDIDAAVLYPEDARYLVGESTVTHYQVVAQVQPAPGQAREPHYEEW
jgi:heme-degrading monooxygenase HmoA